MRNVVENEDYENANDTALGLRRSSMATDDVVGSISELAWTS